LPRAFRPGIRNAPKNVKGFSPFLIDLMIQISCPVPLGRGLEMSPKMSRALALFLLIIGNQLKGFIELETFCGVPAQKA